MIEEVRLGRFDNAGQSYRTHAAGSPPARSPSTLGAFSHREEDRDELESRNDFAGEPA